MSAYIPYAVLAAVIIVFFVVCYLVFREKAPADTSMANLLSQRIIMKRSAAIMVLRIVVLTKKNDEPKTMHGASFLLWNAAVLRCPI